MYRIRQIDAQDDEAVDMLGEFHRLTFFDSAPILEFDQGDWRLALHARRPGWLRRQGSIDARRECRLFFACRRVEKALRSRPVVAHDACDRGRGPLLWMELRGLGHDRQHRVGE
jgi:hypothetical protein